VVRNGRSGGDVDTVWPGRGDAVIDGPPALPLVRAAAALRWSRPDLTATLAELALESALDAGTWVTAAGWLLHGRAALGDGRDTACALLDGLARWGDTAVELMGGPQGRRLRVELAGPARRIGEAAVARALLASTTGADEADLELRADVLTEFARCAVDDAPGTVDDALSAAEEAWRAVASAPGVASVTLLRAARSRRAGRADVAVAEAVAGLSAVDVRGRRAGATASDHVAAALTAEWIAALVDGGRLDEARGEGLAVANRLVATARTSRQVAGLRLAIARITAVEEGSAAVLAALEPAAQAAADSDLPELESACRSMLGELHETAGRLDAALAALRAAMSADRRDRERAAQLRARLATVAATWADRPSTGPTGTGSPGPILTASLDGTGRRPGEATTDGASAAVTRLTVASAEPVEWSRTGPGSSGSGGRERTPGAPGGASGPVVSSSGTGRRARRLAAEALEQPVGGDGGPGDGGVDEGRRSGRGAVPATAGGRVAETGRPATTGRARHGEEQASETVPVPGTPSVPAAAPVPGAVSARGPMSAAGAVQAVYRAAGSGSLIGDALLRELTEGGRPTADAVAPPSGRGADVATHDAAGRPGTGAENAVDDPLFGPLSGEERRGADHPRPSDAGRNGLERESGAGGPAGSAAATDSHPGRWHYSAGRSSLLDDTVVLDVRGDGRADRSARRFGADGRGPAAEDDTGAPAARPSPITAEANGAHADPPYRTGAQNGAQNGAHRNGAHGKGVQRDGMQGDGAHRNGTPRNRGADRPPRDGEPVGDAAATDATARSDGADGSRPARRGTSGRGPGRPPSTDTDGLGLADLLAGALAAYRDL
jgi:hypothetical protein